MKIFTEFIIFHEDSPMPNAEKFCPFLWDGSEFDSDGDFYYEDIDNRWTELSIESTKQEKGNSALDILIYRECDRFYDPGFNTDHLKRFITYKNLGMYKSTDLIELINKPAVASFTFETTQIEHYKGFLETVHFFLEYSQGCLVNYSLFGAERFYKEFLTE